MKRIFALILFLASAANAGTYYVGPGGSDNNPGTSAAPFRQVQRAANLVRAGDVVLVAPGKYDPFKCSADGTATALIRFVGAAGTEIDGAGSKYCASLDGDYNEIEGFELKNSGRRGVQTGGTVGVAVRRCTITGSVEDGVFIWRSREAVVEYCTITDCGTGSEKLHAIYCAESALAGGVDGHVARGNIITRSGSLSMNGRSNVTSSDNLFRGCVVEYNTIVDMPGTGLAMLNCVDATIRGNLVENTGSWPMNIAGGGNDSNGGIVSYRCVFVNNTVVDGGENGIALRQTTSAGGGGHILFNNLTVTSNAAKGIRDDQGGNDLSHNLTLTSAAGVFDDDRVPITGAPPHDTGIGSYRGILAPAIDLAEVARPAGVAIDIGALERAEASAPTPPEPEPGEPITYRVTLWPDGSVTWELVQ